MGVDGLIGVPLTVKSIDGAGQKNERETVAPRQGAWSRCYWRNASLPTEKKRKGGTGNASRPSLFTEGYSAVGTVSVCFAKPKH